jgi:hypothetical protein
MTKSKEISYSDSTLNKCADDEPVFILRAQDKLAPVVIRIWADLAKFHGAGQMKVSTAKQLAHEMEKWADYGRAKMPD